MEVSRGLIRMMGVKHGALSRDMERVFRSAFRRLQKAVLRGDDMEVEGVFLWLINQATTIYGAALAFAVQAAWELLGVEDVYRDSEDEGDRRSIAFWMPTLLLYAENLQSEAAWFRKQAFPSGELMIFLNHPIHYLMQKGVSSAAFRQEVQVGQGRRYEVRKDYTKTLLYALTTAMYDTLREGYMQRGVVAYVGFRNGDYPCETCDEYEGRVMPIEDMVYPLHVNCICGWYELYSDEVSGI